MRKNHTRLIGTFHIMANYTIKDLEKLTGIKTHTIRIWERRYGVIQPARTSTNIRYYCDGDLRKLLNLTILNKNGHKISALSKLSDDDLRNKAMDCVDCFDDKDSGMDLLILATIELNEEKFTSRFQEILNNFGFEMTFEKIILPFLEKLGVLWQVGTINTAQEHFISNILRTRFLSEIQSLPDPSPNSPNLIMYLPEKESHEFSLLYSYYLARKMGMKVIYFGQNLPDEDLKETLQDHDPDFILTAFVTSQGEDHVQKHLQLLPPKLIKKVFITGAQTQNIPQSDLPPHVKVLKGPRDLEELLEQYLHTP